MNQRRCPDLPPELLREISSRLHHVVDFVRFHAVCKPWHDSRDATTTKQPSLLPWLLEPNAEGHKFRCVFSRTSYRAVPPSDNRTWVTNADGTAFWYLADGPFPSLHDPLTRAAVAHLPAFPDRWYKGNRWGVLCLWGTVFGLCGVVYGDGTILLYGLSEAGPSGEGRPTFRAALLRPGDTTWTVLERKMLGYAAHFFVAYHHGRILVTVGPNVWHLVMPGDAVGLSDISVPRPSMVGESDKYRHEYGYALLTRGELLLVSVHVEKGYKTRRWKRFDVLDLVRALSMSVHVLQEDVASGKLRWVRKDRRSLADRVLFLGWPNSFAVDASRLGGDAVSGGCAYFISADYRWFELICVVRYSLIDDKAKLLEQLPGGWDGDMCMWLIPQPTVGRTEETNERLDGSKWWEKQRQQTTPTPGSIINIERPGKHYYNAYFKVIVRNLPCTVDSSQLRHFFSKHGKVYFAKVICKNKTKIPKVFGRVTIATVEKLAEAVAILDGLVFNGCILEVRLVRQLE